MIFGRFDSRAALVSFLVIGFVIGLSSIAVCSDLPRWISEQGGHFEADASSRVIAVKLPFAWVTDADLEPIAAIPTLRSLDLSFSLITDIGMEKLKDLRNVEELNL